MPEPPVVDVEGVEAIEQIAEQAEAVAGPLHDDAGPDTPETAWLVISLAEDARALATRLRAELTAADPHRVDPAGHRGDDVGILNRSFELPRDRSERDHRGPRPLERLPGPGDR